MEELILIALMVGAFYLITQQKKPARPLTPTFFTNSQSTQTEPITFTDPAEEKDLQKTLDNLLRNIRQLNHQIK